MFGSKSRLVIAVEGVPVGARVVPHRDDAEKLVLKAPNPEGAASLAQALGIEFTPLAVEASVRSGLCSVVVSKKDFLDNLRTFAETVIEANVPTTVHVPEEDSEDDDEDEDDDSEEDGHDNPY